MRVNLGFCGTAASSSGSAAVRFGARIAQSGGCSCERDYVRRFFYALVRVLA
jgi:hypothetical protein